MKNNSLLKFSLLFTVVKLRLQIYVKIPLKLVDVFNISIIVPCRGQDFFKMPQWDISNCSTHKKKIADQTKVSKPKLAGNLITHPHLASSPIAWLVSYNTTCFSIYDLYLLQVSENLYSHRFYTVKVKEKINATQVFLERYSINTLVNGVLERSHIYKRIYNFQLQVCLNVWDLLVNTKH